MKLAKNYHEYSIRKEQELFNNLLSPYGDLLVALNALKKLDKTNIDYVISEWKQVNMPSIEQDLAQHTSNLEQYSKEIIKSDIPMSDQAITLFEANKVMLNVTTEYVRQKFTEIGVNEEAYGYNSEMVNNLMDQVVSETSNKLEIFATQSTINNLAQFIKFGVIEMGYSEYRWRTQRDNRVRPTHAAMDGKWFPLDDENPQPAGYKPGIDWGCRCWMWEFR